MILLTLTYILDTLDKLYVKSELKLFEQSKTYVCRYNECSVTQQCPNGRKIETEKKLYHMYT
jgi:hypothetical protein